ncbi:hypothetical protein SED60170_04145 [Salmonella enterica subsp. diarizonae serovar 60:r:e,n,x,z15 str. 01-0170]|nr:hypothetical protein SED60170_04145 [Salmonella enterica subsp. diarizonae serovar 60:r:e,n,x,z15 str. 01-0170]
MLILQQLVRLLAHLFLSFYANCYFFVAQQIT